MLSSSSPPGRTVILWVHPRSTSTMFECALLQRSDFKVLHEPMGDAWYFGSERVSKRYSSSKCHEDFPQFAESTFKKTWDGIVSPSSSDTRRTFSKDMAQYIFPQPLTSSTSPAASFGSTQQPDGNPTLIPTAELLDASICHTFLIRTPQKAIPSYYRLCYPGAPTGFDYFDPSEAGYREMVLLFDFLRSRGREPLVLESEDLLREPETVMKEWCDHVGIAFDPSMLEWNEGTREHFAKWPGFHTSAENSSGIGKGLDAKHITPANHGGEKASLPNEVEDCIADNMASYEYLRRFV